MKNLTYAEQQNIKNLNKLSELTELLPQVANEFFISIEQNTTSLTRLGYARDLKLFFDFLSKKIFNKPVKTFTNKDFASITPLDIEKYLSTISVYQNNKNVRTNGDKAKARKLSSIRCFLKFLFSRDYINSDVSVKVKSPKIRLKEIIRLEADEVSKLIDQAEDGSLLSKTEQKFNKNTKERDVAMLSLMLGTGIRVSECIGIDIDDLDFDNNAFKVTRKGGYKTILYFSEEIRELLISWLEKRASQLKDNTEEPALFISLQNKRINVRTVEKLVKKYAHVVTPLKKITPHKLRSTYGTNLYRETKDIYIVADVLGHKDVNTTKRHYAAISEDLRRDVAEKVKLR